MAELADKGKADGRFDPAKKFQEQLARDNKAGDAKPGDRARLAQAMAGAKPAAPGHPGGAPAGGAGKPFPGGGGAPAGGQPFGGPAGPGGFGGPGFPPPPVVMPFVVREYAHQRDAALGEVRSDFTETVYWHPVKVLPEGGKGFVEFQLSDDIARYQVLVAGHTLDGRIGAVTKTIEARQPFSVDPKLPLEVSHTDTIDVPLRVTNDSDDARKVALGVAVTGLKPDGAVPEFIDLGPNGKGRQMLRLRADKLTGPATVGLTGTSGPDKDSILRAITVVPDGFPGVGSVSDMLEKGRATGSVKVPKDVVPGTLKVRLEVYPTSMADLVKGLDGLLREPYGCFEQTSTTNYPNTLILDYMNQTNQTNPEAARRAKDLLDKGYGRLISLRVPGHPAEGEAGVRVVRRGRPAARSAHRVRPDAVQGHGPRSRGRSAADQADAGVPALPQGRATAGSSGTRGRWTASAVRRSTPPTRTSSGRWSRATRTTPRTWTWRRRSRR